MLVKLDARIGFGPAQQPEIAQRYGRKTVLLQIMDIGLLKTSA